MDQKFGSILQQLAGRAHATRQFDGGDDSDNSFVQKLNAAFLIVLCGPSHPDYKKAEALLNRPPHDEGSNKIAAFYRDGIKLIQDELAVLKLKNPEVSALFDLWAEESSHSGKPGAGLGSEAGEKFWRLFFPEGLEGREHWEKAVDHLREERTVRVTRLNPDPIRHPAEEILFTSNILLTTPQNSHTIKDLPLAESVRDGLKQAAREPQRYWYDHPVPIGVAPENNEILHGLRGLSDCLEFEQQRGVVEPNAQLTCLLSVSLTHEGLQYITKTYLEETLGAEAGIKGMELYAFTERDTRRLLDEVIIPAAERYRSHENYSTLHEIIGIDGEYGRHYTFLKAVSALWKVLINPGIKASFKIDLDQVFPQKELVEETGASAFEHFKTPLWGAEGIDQQGHKIELGMIAGALVNERDISNSLFTPDVSRPDHSPQDDEVIFFSKIPQALSTEAEMMTRYGHGNLDGRTRCIQRVHVTGGTNGILVKSLRKYRPFTPASIGRAEDQAYLMSVLFENSDGYLRVLHKDGLIMRHDKESIAGDAIRTAALGKLIGDYARILLFSFYAQALPWTLKEIKNLLDPFTGCFISKIPITVVYLRTALKAASFFEEGMPEADQEGSEFIEMAAGRLHEMVLDLCGDPNPLIERYRREKEAWNLFYDVLDDIERNLEAGEAFALDLQAKAKALVADCMIRIGPAPTRENGLTTQA